MHVLHVRDLVRIPENDCKQEHPEACGHAKRRALLAACIIGQTTRYIN